MYKISFWLVKHYQDLILGKADQPTFFSPQTSRTGLCCTIARSPVPTMLLIAKIFTHLDSKSCGISQPSISLLYDRGGKLGEPGKPDGSPLFWEIICNFQICKIMVYNTNGS